MEEQEYVVDNSITLPRKEAWCLYQYTRSTVSEHIGKSISRYGAYIRDFNPGQNISAGLAIDYSITNRYGDKEYIRTFLNEFPGNCSTLVFSNIQHFAINQPKLLRHLINMALEICSQCYYGQLVITTTTQPCCQILEEMGFECTNTVQNPHSDNKNYFYRKVIV